MKFRTEIEIAPLGTKIGYENRILALGSCFAEHIAGRLAQAKFRVTANPSGILFNPLSIAAALRSYAGEKPVRHSELGFDGELWFHYGFHGSFSAPEADQALAAMNAARKSGAEALRAADRIVLTFGTAWVYEHDGAVVANCHRRPAAEFTRRRLGVDEIVTAFADLMAGPLGGREVILTVSPVRHLGDSLAGNAVSKPRSVWPLKSWRNVFQTFTISPHTKSSTTTCATTGSTPTIWCIRLRRPWNMSGRSSRRRFSRSRPGVCCPTSAISSWPRRTGPATRRAQPTASSAAAGSKRSRRCRRSIFGPKRNISADVSK